MPNSIVQQLKFKHTWRPYQSRVLTAIDQHLEDRRLHIVAAPGAGKTTLGLEAFRRIGEKALVLSPTRVIRNQWIERLTDFLQDEIPPSDLPWVSHDLRTPGFLTSVTYQALHSIHRNHTSHDGEEAEEETKALSRSEIQSISNTLKKGGIKVLILDEAHHLRAEWWKAINNVIEDIPEIQVISLTGTPPYEASGHEWSKYQSLCGPIDEEISVPELVKAGTLCPHQDLCYFVGLNTPNQQRLKNFETTVNQTVHTIDNEPLFHTAIVSHPWLNNESVSANELLENTEFCFALLIYLKYRAMPAPKSLLEKLAIDDEEIAPMDMRWWNILISNFLFNSTFILDEEQTKHQKQLTKELRAKELLSRKTLNLFSSQEIKTALSTSLEKAEACADIYQLERAFRQSTLRQVILCDFIRDEEGIDSLRSKNTNLGAWPIFKRLLKSAKEEHLSSIAMLTGRLVIVHNQHIEKLRQYVPNCVCTQAPFHPQFVRIDADTHQLSNALTQLLNTGDIQVLIGTRALLGEGWDCPAVNSLILASFIGSFMMTNQMRGRAIRIDKNNPDKISSIWHIVAIETNQSCGGLDLEALATRFKTFVGLSHTGHTIESGLERISLPFDKTAHTEELVAFYIKENNREMERRLNDLDSTKDHWQSALTRAHEHRVIPGVSTGSPPKQYKALYFRHTMKWLVVEAVTGFVSTSLNLLSELDNFDYDEWRTLIVVISIMFGLAFVAALPNFVRATRAWIKHLPVDGSLIQMGSALKDALCDTGMISTDKNKLQVSSSQEKGHWTIYISGASFYEQSLFADSLNELLGPIDNPRYLITRQQGNRIDFHAVPTAIASHKKKAQLFYDLWQQEVAKSELIYTRDEIGKQQLLKARSRAFSSMFVATTERKDHWR